MFRSSMILILYFCFYGEKLDLPEICKERIRIKSVNEGQSVVETKREKIKSQIYEGSDNNREWSPYARNLQKGQATKEGKRGKVTPRQGVIDTNKASKVTWKLVKESFGFVRGIRGLTETWKEVVTDRDKSIVSGMSSFWSEPLSLPLLSYVKIMFSQDVLIESNVKEGWNMTIFFLLGFCFRLLTNPRPYKQVNPDQTQISEAGPTSSRIEAAHVPKREVVFHTFSCDYWYIHFPLSWSSEYNSHTLRAPLYGLIPLRHFGESIVSVIVLPCTRWVHVSVILRSFVPWLTRPVARLRGDESWVLGRDTVVEG